uniref:Putative reverse transcriptase-like protein n=1 Tax=viral metagenome TaxID=1070528 RepID=A0A6H1ZJI4_9ZZZZ
MWYNKNEEEKGAQMTTTIYTDGSTRDICFIIGNQHPKIRAATEGPNPVTVNAGEYYALLQAMHVARAQGIRDIIVKSDSQLMVRQLTKKPDGSYVYKVKTPSLFLLHTLVKDLEEDFNSVTYKWVPREQNLAGIELEKLAKGK